MSQHPRLYLLEIFVQEGDEDDSGYPIPDERLLVRLTPKQRKKLDLLLEGAANEGNDLVHHWNFHPIEESKFESIQSLVEEEYFDPDDDYESGDTDEFDEEAENEEGSFFGDDNEH